MHVGDVVLKAANSFKLFKRTVNVVGSNAITKGNGKIKTDKC